MDAGTSGNSHRFFGPVVHDPFVADRKNLEWDLNNWGWDGDLFTARQISLTLPETWNGCRAPYGNVSLCNRLASCSGEPETVGNENVNGGLDFLPTVVENENVSDESGSLKLNLGARAYPVRDGDTKHAKKTKVTGNPYFPACQVDDCLADLSHAKDYHRRHKVCSLHSKACSVLVGNIIQRFCQQCSRFHALQEFDEGKRSCRRRLSGHNKRRRKTHPEGTINGSSLNGENNTSYLLISLLRIISNLHANDNRDGKNDQDILSLILTNVANHSGMSNANAALMENAGSVSCEVGPSNQPGNRAEHIPPQDGKFVDDTSNRFLHPALSSELNMNKSVHENEQRHSAVPIKLNGLDLNYAYDDSHELGGAYTKCYQTADQGMASPFHFQSSHLDNQMPRLLRSEPCSSSFNKSHCCHGGDAKGCTDRIVFKLFGKDPVELPEDLRKQFLDWLSHSPTEIESYIKPGCIVLTIYLCMEWEMWEKICFDLGSSLSVFLSRKENMIFKVGWVYAMVRHHATFIYNGKVLEPSFSLDAWRSCSILSIRPIAVPVSERTQFVVKGVNICRPTTRLLCAFEGKYLVQETELSDGFYGVEEQKGCKQFAFYCCTPDAIGRGFIELEDLGFGSSFFPFIVAEKEVCSEICLLEDSIEAAETDGGLQMEPETMKAKDQALEFVHEIGWLLHRYRLRFRLGDSDPNPYLFSLKRFKWLLEFSLDHDWSAVVRMLLMIFFDGAVDARGHPSMEHAVSHLGLLHRAARRKQRPMVEQLLKYIPDAQADTSFSHKNQQHGASHKHFLFRPDDAGPTGLTPLHIAASDGGSEAVIDALTDDPGLVGIKAWDGSKDNSGLTPKDYASLHGHYSYIHLVQRKIAKSPHGRHVAVDIHDTGRISGRQSVDFESSSIDRPSSVPPQQRCRQCKMKLACAELDTSHVYRPAVLSMVAIATVCVCVALLFKSSPQVIYAFGPFRWELLKYGSS